MILSTKKSFNPLPCLPRYVRWSWAGGVFFYRNTFVFLLKKTRATTRAEIVYFYIQFRHVLRLSFTTFTVGNGRKRKKSFKIINKLAWNFCH